MNNHEEKYCYRKKRAEKVSANIITEDVFYDEIFIAKTSNQEYDSKIFIVDSGSISHMVNSEDNMTNLKETKTKFTVGYRKTITGTKHGDWHGWQKHNGKLHHVILTNMAVILGLYANLFRIIRALQKKSK